MLITLTLVLPGSTVAIGMLLGYGRWLADTVVIILLAYLAKLWTLAHRPISAAVDRVPPEGLRAARVSGATLSHRVGHCRPTAAPRRDDHRVGAVLSHRSA